MFSVSIAAMIDQPGTPGAQSGDPAQAFNYDPQTMQYQSPRGLAPPCRDLIGRRLQSGGLSAITRSGRASLNRTGTFPVRRAPVEAAHV